jgi:ABC-2 type transport system ATP-binding protein
MKIYSHRQLCAREYAPQHNLETKETCQQREIAVPYREDFEIDSLFSWQGVAYMSANAQTTTQVAQSQIHGQEAIVVDNFSKRYGSLQVVDHLHFTVQHGELFALLGPNGAGKTTTVETLEGYRTADEGCVRVLGLDPIRQAQQLKPRIGVMLQQDGLYPALTAYEVLQLFAGYYQDSLNPKELLERVGLTTAAKTRCRRLSGGQKRRLALAVALLGKPEVVFLDEPTAGMDPQARQTTWEIVRELKRDGVTIVLTTHLMDEAERLADRVAIIDHGRLIALDTPANMTGVQNANIVRFVAPQGLDCQQISALPTAHKAEEIRAGSYVIEIDAVPNAVPIFLAELTAWLRDKNITLSELRVGHGSLEDLFLRLTGSEVRE